MVVRWFTRSMVLESVSNVLIAKSSDRPSSSGCEIEGMDSESHFIADSAACTTESRSGKGSVLDASSKAAEA